MPWIVFQVIVILFGLARLVGSLVLVAFLSAVILAWVWIVINIVIIIIIIIKNSKSSKLASMISTTNKTIGDEGITVGFRFIKVHTSN